MQELRTASIGSRGGRGMGMGMGRPGPYDRSDRFMGGGGGGMGGGMGYGRGRGRGNLKGTFNWSSYHEQLHNIKKIIPKFSEFRRPFVCLPFRYR